MMRGPLSLLAGSRTSGGFAVVFEWIQGSHSRLRDPENIKLAIHLM